MWKVGRGLILLGLCAFLIFVWVIKAAIISDYLDAKLGVAVSLKSIKIRPSKTIIKNLTLDNPPGFKERNALKIDRCEVLYRLKKLRGTPHRIDFIGLKDVVLYIEINGARGRNNNWGAIGASMIKERKSREVIVDRLLLKNLDVIISGKGARLLGIAGKKHFDSMEFSDLNSKEGFPTKELIEKLFRGAGIQRLLEDFLRPKNTIQKALKRPFNLFGERKLPEAPGAFEKD